MLYCLPEPGCDLETKFQVEHGSTSGVSHNVNCVEMMRDCRAFLYLARGVGVSRFGGVRLGSPPARPSRMGQPRSARSPRRVAPARLADLTPSGCDSHGVFGWCVSV